MRKTLRGNISKDAKRIGENFLSLSVLNFVNYGFPLILIPYLTRVLGVAGYGEYAFAFTVLNYLGLLVKYGFEYSATKQVAIIRDDKEKLNRLFYSVLAVRLFFAFGAIILLGVFVAFVPKFQDIQELLFIGSGIFIGVVGIPVWFFQGVENMKFMTVVNFVIRLVSTLLIFLFVKSPSDNWLVMLFQSIGYVLGAIVSLCIAYWMFKIRFVIPSKKEIFYQIKDGWHLFLSTIGMNFYRESNILILGFLTDYSVVGLYASAEKAIKAIQSVISPFVNALFPYFGRKLNSESNSNNVKTFMKIGKIYSLVLVFISIVLLLLAPIIINIYLGDNFIDTIINFRVLSLIVLLGGLNYYYGIVGLVNMNKEKEFSRSVWISGLISITVCFVLVSFYNGLGASIAMVCAEVILFIQIMFYVFIKNRILL